MLMFTEYAGYTKISKIYGILNTFTFDSHCCDKSFASSSQNMYKPTLEQWLFLKLLTPSILGQEQSSVLKWMQVIQQLLKFP